MELNADLISVQGLLSSLVNRTGEFTKINYRGGNEGKILIVTEEISKLLSSKNYIKNGLANDVFQKQLDDIVLFLALNTRYKSALELDEYFHLMNIVPQLSKCLLANIVYAFDLFSSYGNAMEKLPLQNGVELLEEIIICLKKSKPDVHLEAASIILKACRNKLTTLEYSNKLEDALDNFNEVTNMMLRNLTGIYSDQTKNMKTKQIYQHMGYSLLKLFDLLLICDKDMFTLTGFLLNLINTCSNIFRNVTINVFCTWAEIEENGQPLQTHIAEKAYLVIEKFQKYKLANELISMLSQMARKPKSLHELIREADVTTIINKINSKDQGQKEWFTALVNTQVLKNKDSMNCVSKWSHLCTESDVSRLLDLSMESKDIEAKKLVLKCAANLNNESLSLVITRHFYKNRFNNILIDDISQQATLIFNKMNNNDDGDFLTKEVMLLVLQNPVETVKFLYIECLKCKFYTDKLRPVFVYLKEIAGIYNMGINALVYAINDHVPHNQNVDNFVALFDVLLQIGVVSELNLLTKVFLVFIKERQSKENLSELDCMLQIIQNIQIKIPVTKKNEELLTILLDLMRANRCNFLEFDALKQQVTKNVVEIITHRCQRDNDSDYNAEPTSEDDDHLHYYKHYLTSDSRKSLFDCLFPNFNPDNDIECVKLALKILPLCVTSEWLEISRAMKDSCGSEKTAEIFVHASVLLCELVQAQINQDKNNLNGSLKYCLQQFGMVVQQVIQVGTTLDEEESITKLICRLLRKIPDVLKQQIGLSLVNIMSERALKKLSADKEFVGLVVIINDTKICQTIAQKMIK